MQFPHNKTAFFVFRLFWANKLLENTGKIRGNLNRGKIDNYKEYSHMVRADYRQAERVAVVAVSRTQPSVLGARSSTA